MKISIIIPTFNEENYIPLLLGSLKKQSYKDYEVIVADANSSDNTVQIAKEFGATVVSGGMPAKGRNSGAQKAKGEFLFFLDADVILPDDFLKSAYDEIEQRFLDLATCEIIPLSNLSIDKILHELVNLSMRVGQYMNPHAGGCCIICAKRLYDRVMGFDESLTMAEDHDFIKRASKFRPLRVLDSTTINLSVRRLEKEGRAVLLRKYLQVELYRIFKGEVKNEIIEYEFGNFDKDVPEKQLKQIMAFEELLIHLNKKLHDFKKPRKECEEIMNDIPPQEVLDKFKMQFDKIKGQLIELFKKNE